MRTNDGDGRRSVELPGDGQLDHGMLVSAGAMAAPAADLYVGDCSLPGHRWRADQVDRVGA